MPSNPFRRNLVRIAEYATKSYLELQRNYGNRFKNETSLLATAGVLTAQDYVLPTNAKISVSEIISMVNDAVSNEKAKDPLFPFILSLETEMQVAEDPHLDRQRIRLFLYMKAESIIKAVEKTRKTYKGDNRIAFGASQFMQSEEFKSVRKKLNIAD